MVEAYGCGFDYPVLVVAGVVSTPRVPMESPKGSSMEGLSVIKKKVVVSTFI